jgi:transcriptional regulator with XRE-family HTH domain
MAEADGPTFGELLGPHRLAAHLTQEELAERAQLSRRAIQELERGTRSRPRRETVHLLAEALGLDTPARASLEVAARLARTPGTNGLSLAHLRVELPVLLSNFVGRERELAQVSRLLGVARLVTLTGAGGIGKTRLAMRVASSVAHQFTGCSGG